MEGFNTGDVGLNGIDALSELVDLGEELLL